MNKNEIKSIFLGKQKSWKDGSRVNPVLYTKSKIFDHFSRTYTGRPKHLFKAHWRKLVFTGAGKAPKGFSSEEEVIRYVRHTEGAIGFVSSEAQIENVKVIKITDRGEDE